MKNNMATKIATSPIKINGQRIKSAITSETTIKMYLERYSLTLY